MNTLTPLRTPLHEMSDEQLRFIVEDELAAPWRREIAETLLGEREIKLGQEESALVQRISAYT